MSIYKPSLPRPDLAEIDVLENDVEFQVQINTSGTVVKQFVVEIWSADGEELVFRSGVNDVRPFIQNKGILKWKLNQLRDLSDKPPSEYLQNGRDYQWTVRTYEELQRNSDDFTRLPRTFVCSGYLVGSTKSVLWVKNGTEDGGSVSNQIDKLEEGKYVQITCTYQNGSLGETAPNKFLPPTPPNPENLILPIDYDKNTSEKQIYKERHKIEYLTKELGINKDVAKIELDEPFKYNYIDGVQFQVFDCSNNHSLTSVYVDPNDIIERGKFIKISTSSTYDANSKWRKIIGYGEETGEVRVQENFDSVPTDGMYYWIGETEGDTIKKLDNPSNNIVGGDPWDNKYWVMSNKWNVEGKPGRLFVQPNINIIPDEHNPDTIMIRTMEDFQEEVPINIQAQFQAVTSTTDDGFRFKKNVDYTFDKLDNTQWLLTGGAISPNPPVYHDNDKNIDRHPLCYPQTPYKVFTDFQDLSPNGYFYARKTPTIMIGMCGSDILGREDPNNPGTYYDFIYLPSTGPNPSWEYVFRYGDPIGWRDITFKTSWQQEQEVQTKYYRYTLYDEIGKIIAQSEEKYDIDYTWEYKGFLSPEDPEREEPIRYAIEIKIVDQYGKEFTEKAPFKVAYTTISGNVDIINITFDCEEMAYKIQASIPEYVRTSDYEQYKTVDDNDMDPEGILVAGQPKPTKFLTIPKGEILNYDRLEDDKKSPFDIPDKHTFYAQFQLTPVIVEGMAIGEERTILEYSYLDEELQRQSVVKLTFGGLTSYYMQDEKVQENEKRFKIFIYIDDQPVNLFRDKDNNPVNYIDLREKRSDFASPNDVYYALQNLKYYQICTEFPDESQIIREQIYLLTNDYESNGKLYSPGPYTYSDGRGWQVDPRYEYFYIDNVNQAPLNYQLDENGNPLTGRELRDQVKEKMRIPENCFELFGQTAYADASNYWVDNINIDSVNKEVLERFWMEFYFVHDGENNIRKAQLEVNSTIRLPVRS